MSDTAEADLEAIAARLAAVEAEVADAALVRYTADAGATVLEPVAGAVDGIEPAAAWSISVEDAGAAEATSAGDAEASPPLPVSVAQSRVLEGLRSSGVAGAWFHRVASDYYDRPLASRAKLLRAPQAHLCKTLVLENTEWQAPGAARGGGAAATAAGAAGGADAEALYSRFYCVVVQYTSKLRPDVLAKQLRHREGRGRSIAAYKFQLAKEEVSAPVGCTRGGDARPLPARPRPPARRRAP